MTPMPLSPAERSFLEGAGRGHADVFHEHTAGLSWSAEGLTRVAIAGRCERYLAHRGSELLTMLSAGGLEPENTSAWEALAAELDATRAGIVAAGALPVAVAAHLRRIRSALSSPAAAVLILLRFARSRGLV